MKGALQDRVDDLSGAIDKASSHARSIGDAYDIFGSLTIEGKNPEFDEDGTEVTLEKNDSSVEMEIERGDIKDLKMDGDDVRSVAKEIFTFLNNRIKQEGEDPYADMKKTGISPQMPIPRELRVIFDKGNK